MKTSAKLKKNGWAPGWYTNNCTVCGDDFIGDKRAYECHECAYSEDRDNYMNDEDIQIRAMALTAKLRVSELEETIHKAYHLLKADRDDEAYMLLELAVKEKV